MNTQHRKETHNKQLSLFHRSWYIQKKTKDFERYFINITLAHYLVNISFI